MKLCDRRFMLPALSVLLMGLSPSLGQAAELREIRQRGYLVIAIKENIRPLGFRDPSGKLQGLEIDIAQRLAQELLGQEVGQESATRLQAVENRDRLQAVESGKVDLAIAKVTRTPSRERIVNFSIPYYIDGVGFITRDPAIQSLRDLTRRTIVLLKGSSTISQVRFLYPNAQLIGVDSYQQAQELLESGKAAAFAGDTTVLTGWQQEFPSYRVLPTQISSEALCIVLPKGLHHEPLRQAVNEAITRMERSGWLQERIRYWGLPENRPVPVR